jgi:hypothetical protein
MNIKKHLLTSLLPFITFISFAQNNAQKIYETEDYKIEFPSAFKKTVQPLQTAVGELQMTTVAYEPDEQKNDQNFVYMLMAATYPASAIPSNDTAALEAFFRAVINGSVNGINGRLINESSGKIANCDFRLIEIDYGNGEAVVKIKMVLKDATMVLIQSFTDPKKYPNTSLDKFFDSFALKNN